MKQDFFAVLDIGSSKITCMAGNGVSGGEFVIRAVGQCDYNGFDENGWYEPQTVGECIKSAINQVENKTNARIKKIIVGVPANFCYLAINEATTAFRIKKRIDTNDIIELCDKANVYENNKQCKYIGSTPLYFLVDGGFKVIDPVGTQTQRLTAVVSFSFMSTVFENVVTEALSNIGVKNIQFVNTAELQAKFIARTNNVNDSAIIIDIGFITSYVMFTASRGLMYLKSFSLGRGHIAGDLRSLLDISYNNALQLLDKLNLNLEYRADDVYSLNGGVNVEAVKANDIVKARIEQFADYIKRCFQNCNVEIPSTTPVILTGGGLSYIKGGADCLADFLTKEVQVYQSNNPQTNRNEYTSVYGLLMYAITHQDDKKGDNALIRWFKRLIGGK